MTKKKAKTGIPKGYKPYDGKGCPTNPEQYVDLIIRTAEGFGHSGAVRARLHDWEQNESDGLGHVVAWREADRWEEIDLRARWPER
jgi:hypothetical protein